MDAAVGEVVQEVADLGVERDTIMVFASDVSLGGEGVPNRFFLLSLLLLIATHFETWWSTRVGLFPKEMVCDPPTLGGVTLFGSRPTG